MRKYDLYWMSNREWFTLSRKGAVLNPDAPQEAQESYQRYLEQTKNNKILPAQEFYMLGNEEDPPSKTGKRQTILK